ncbi:MAG TPA: M1 family metallopeptidase [Steroidobacteraceae bacterium]|nr:M1 family metallopeptidase [Steroidobacteraceae bacterium]
MIRIPAGAALALLYLAVPGFGAAAAAGGKPARETLPDTVIPSHYDLALTPDAEALTFSGKVTIDVTVRAATPDVVLNAVGLHFVHATADGGRDAAVTFDRETGRAALRFGAPLKRGKHKIAIEYDGTIARGTLGFFAMDYSSPEGPRRTLATNFEPAEARRLLPCWDEPARKATFTVSIDEPRDRMALSNMPVASITPLSGTLQRVRFAETPRMSTYLLFVGVGDFERIHRSIDGVDVGVVVKRGDTPKAAYALEQAVELLHYYNGYFGVRYPLPKLDLIASPGAIQGGSMENWGAIFYSQNHVLFDPATSTEADRQVVFQVVSHEMAHQWFGDLVTMSWWSDLWLNEGFARWMQTFAADALHPEWETGLQASSIFEAGKQADAVPSTHAVVQEILTPAQADQAFDSITYAKGAAIISMLNAYVGQDRFREGVRQYMRAHEYGNTTDSDLWTVMQRVVGKPILAIEHDFTRQEGVPLVRVTQTGSGVRLAEGRFAQDPETIRALPRQHWRLPLVVGPVVGEKRTVLLEDALDVRSQGAMLVNAGQLGYARVLYDDATFAALVPQVGTLAPMDQVGLLNDAYALGVAGYSPLSRLLQLPATLPPDANPIVWGRLIRLLTQLESHYSEGPARTAFRHFALELLAPLASHLGTVRSPAEAANLSVLRGVLLQAQADFGDADVIAAARRNFAGGSGTPEERRIDLAIVAAHADPATFASLLERARSADDPLDKLHLFTALGGVMDAGLARRMTDIALSDEVPAGVGPSILAVLARRHADVVWQAVAPQLDDPAIRLDPQERWGIAVAIAGQSADPRRIADLEAYEARSVPPEARKPSLGAVASIRQNVRFATQLLPQIDSWIAHGG